MRCFQRWGCMFQRAFMSAPCSGWKIQKVHSVQNQNLEQFYTIGFSPYAQCHQPSCSSSSTKHVFQKLPTSNPGMFPCLYYQACNWFHFSIKTCLSKRGTVHLFHACNKLCKKFNPPQFAALQNCERAYVASESLCLDNHVHISRCLS